MAELRLKVPTDNPPLVFVIRAIRVVVGARDKASNVFKWKRSFNVRQAT